MRIKLFGNKETAPAERRCPGCCNNCPESSLKCDKGREKLGLKKEETGTEE